MAQNLQTGLSIKGLTADTNTLQIRNSSNNTTFIVDNTGNVGIGTMVPDSKLSFGDYYINTLNPSSTGQTSHIRLYDDPSIGSYGFGVSTDSLNIAANQNTGRINFYTNSIKRVTIDSNNDIKLGVTGSTQNLIIKNNGNVGIGYDTPTVKLSFGEYYINSYNPTQNEQASHIRLFEGNNANSVYGFGVSTDSLNIVANQNDRPCKINFYTNTGITMTIVSNGNVGIGTSTPSEKLEVSGKTKTTNLQVTNGATPGYVLTATDNLGNMSWQAPTGGGGGGGTFTGGTVAGGTSFTNGLTANTFTIGGVTYNSLTNLDDTTNLGTGITIHFSARTIFNLPDSPASGNISGDTTNAKFGMVQKIYHQSSIEPTFQSNWKLIGEGVYFTNQLNIIYAEYITNSRIEYWIIQEY